MDAEPKATSKHTLCGYAWGDVTSSLQKAIGAGDVSRALRWSAELICSDLGLGRLEATLFQAWAHHIRAPDWCRTWHGAIRHLRENWAKSGGDIKVVRNTTAVRQLVAEAVAALVLAPKRPLPTLPTSTDCFREAAAMRARLRGGGSGDQYATRRIWAAGQDGDDLKTIGNEMEAAIRGNQPKQVLFWTVWMITLDGQTEAPKANERGPAHLTPKQRKSILWFLVALWKDLANEFNFLSADVRAALFGTLELTWSKLGSGRKDVLAAIGLMLTDHCARRPLNVLPSYEAIREAASQTDKMYSEIAEEARRFALEKPIMALHEGKSKSMVPSLYK